MAQQLSFELPVSVSQGAEDFFVAPPNAQAYAMITNDQTWPDGKLALVGPKGSGKSHLARVWQQLSQAEELSAPDLTGAEPLPDAGATVAVEDVEYLPKGAEELLFHLHNHLRATGGRLLLTASAPPSRWPIALPDLASRMQAATVVQIDDPDDDLLRAVMYKQFADRQLTPSPGVVSYLIPRLERSFAAVAQIVAHLDDTALSQKVDITRPLAREVLAKLQDSQA
jgi:chromosomal replication initiation ATPase DnaA